MMEISEQVCEVMQKLNDERFARDKERLDKLEELTTKVSECNLQMSEMVKAHNDKLDAYDKRLQQIEDRPRDWIDKIISGAIAAIVAFVMGVIL